MNDVDRNRFLGFCRAIDLRGSNNDPLFLRETILHLLRIYYWDFYVLFQQKTSAKKRPFVNTNKENIAMRFAMLVSEHHKTRREVAFYADKLCISPVYLTKVIQEVNGQSAHEMIADYVVIEIKTLLRDARLDIKAVARRARLRQPVFAEPLFPPENGHVSHGVPPHDPCHKISSCSVLGFGIPYRANPSDDRCAAFVNRRAGFSAAVPIGLRRRVGLFREPEVNRCMADNAKLISCAPAPLNKTPFLLRLVTELLRNVFHCARRTDSVEPLIGRR